MRVNLGLVAMVGFGLLSAVPVRAHHAFAAEFDAHRPVKLQGTLAKVEWVNPHAWIHIDVKGPDGQMERWLIEAGGPNVLTKRGLTKDFLKAGTEIVVDGFLAKGVPHRANGRLITTPDGRSIFLGSSGTGAPQDGKDSSEKP
jgi:hypothetical protein